MKIQKYTKLLDNYYNVKIDDIDVKLYDDVIVKFELLRIKEIDEKLYTDILKYNNELDAYYKSLKYITKKMRNKKEIIKYLEKEYSSEIIDKTIQKLYQDGYLNDLLYIECFINDQVNFSNNGPLKILNLLKDLGFEREDILNKLNEIDKEIFLNKIKKIIEKKIKLNHKYSENKLKEKLLIDLSNLGYERTQVLEVLDNIQILTPDNLLEKEYKKNYDKLAKKYSGDELKYRLKNKLLTKGFSYEEIQDILENID